MFGVGEQREAERYLSSNFFCFAGLSGLMPRSGVADLTGRCRAGRTTAAVQPGVSAFG